MEYIIKGYIFMIGIIFGSFFNVCIYRIPKNESIVNPPSHCTSCNTRLKPIDLIPIISYICSKRKCRYCKEKISIRYSLVEFITGILFLLVYNLYGFTLKTPYFLLLVSLLIIITFVDIEYFIILDELLILGAIFAFISNMFGVQINIIDCVLGAIISGVGMLTLIKLIEIIIRKECMGRGDIKLFGMIGLFLGVKDGLLTILISIYVGAIYGLVVILYSKIKKTKYNSMIPYGPFISISAIIVMIYGNNIIDWYISLI
ncbi:prepilin peptidase [Romboutsia maritimum]|uniref:Prepilin peptidase n=1 Tax=Romboutsia maritimum TaxID=2020948 RepID=A0A371ISZ1_9FIRM|nr:A24 family peptidase [Romboutsia maritimum]RDY23600.1 prepilin peptidase [Romboutsia maritimum]